MKAGFVDGLATSSNKKELAEKYKEGFVKGMKEAKETGKVLGQLEY